MTDFECVAKNSSVDVKQIKMLFKCSADTDTDTATSDFDTIEHNCTVNLDIIAGWLPPSPTFHFSTISRHPLFELTGNFILRQTLK